MKEKPKRVSVVSVRFLPEEKQKLTRLADEQHTTLSQLLRLTVLKQASKIHIKYVPEVNRRLYRELGKISEYLQATEVSPELLSDLQELLDEMRRELMGMSRTPEQSLNKNEND